MAERSRRSKKTPSGHGKEEQNISLVPPKKKPRLVDNVFRPDLAHNYPSNNAVPVLTPPSGKHTINRVPFMNTPMDEWRYS